MSPLACVLGIALVVALLVLCRVLFDAYDLRAEQRAQAEADAERVRRALAAVNRRSLGDPSSDCNRPGTQARGLVTR